MPAATALSGLQEALVLTSPMSCPMPALFLATSLLSLTTLGDCPLPRSLSSQRTEQNLTYFSSLLTTRPTVHLHCRYYSTYHLPLAPVHTKSIFHPSVPGKPYSSFKAQRTTVFFPLPLLPPPFTTSPFLSVWFFPPFANLFLFCVCGY